MRYFVYVSSSKIEMLYSQISAEDRRRLAVELKVNLGLLEATVTSPQPDESIFPKVDVVTAYLDHRSDIGTCSEPRAFFRGVLDMNFAEAEFYRGGGRMILFSGSTGTRIVGLVGSATHVVGAPKMDSATLGYAQPEFWLKVADSLQAPDEMLITQNMYDVDNMIDYQARRRPDAPKQRLEFLAKKFMARQGIIIGSPVYVASAE